MWNERGVVPASTNAGSYHLTTMAFSTTRGAATRSIG
jgi:hypothetical protein